MPAMGPFENGRDCNTAELSRRQVSPCNETIFGGGETTLKHLASNHAPGRKLVCVCVCV
jgi:hypothetical protein